MPGLLTPAQLRKQIAAGALDPLYAITGDDDAAKGRVAQAFAEAVEDGLRGLNVERLYVRDTGPDESRAGLVVAAARTLPMLAPRRIVIVPDAEGLLLPKKKKDGDAAEDTSDGSAAGDPPARGEPPARGSRPASNLEVETLEAYFRAPEPQTALVLMLPDLSEAQKKRRPLRTFLEHATVVEFPRSAPSDDSQLDWIEATVSRAGMAIDPRAARLLAERAAGDRSRLRAETERACLYAAGRGRITRADVEAVAGPPGVRDAWDVVRKMERGSAADALRQLHLLFEAGGNPFMILGQIRSFVERRMPSADAVEALLRTDLALKNSGGDPRVLLERLVVELVGSRSEQRRTESP